MKYLAAVITAFLFTFGLSAPAQAHDTDTPGCVNLVEFREVDEYDVRIITQKEVFGTDGTFVNHWKNNGHNFAKKHYKSCSGNRQFRVLWKDGQAHQWEWLWKAVSLPPCGC